MIIVLSPAKSLDWTPGAAGLPVTTPQMLEQTAELSKTTRRLKRADLKRLMGISDALADLNFQRFQAFDPDSEEGLQAAIAFDGDVYTGLDARSLDKKAIGFAQTHVRILSGLYGLLRPLDLIQPYRLEMGTRLKTRRGSNLYAFWGPRIAEALNETAEGHKDRTLVNCASQEYFGAVDPDALKLPLVTCHFLEEKDGESRVISFYAKKARGLMARYAIDRRIDRADALKDFDLEGYRFRPDASTDTDWVFSRPQPPPKS
jgi:cytoplasmic iron level regulating protein YaaA (DUF328/UPF0246 family)